MKGSTPAAQLVSFHTRVKELGTLRSDDSDSNENAKKAIPIGLITKTTILLMHHACLYISLLSLHDYGLKMPNLKFYKGSTQVAMKFPLSSF